MSVIIRLQNLPWSANALDIRGFFRGLSIPDGGVHIVGGEMGDAFIAFSTDEDARQAMMLDRGKLNEVQIRLLLSSRAEMQKVIEQARQQSFTMMQLASKQPQTVQQQSPQLSQIPQPPIITSTSLQNILSQQKSTSFIDSSTQQIVSQLLSDNSTDSRDSRDKLLITDPTKKNDRDYSKTKDRERSGRSLHSSRSRSRSHSRSRSRSRDRRRSRSRDRDRSSARRRGRRSRTRSLDRRSRKRRSRERSLDRNRDRDRSDINKNNRERSRSRDRIRDSNDKKSGVEKEIKQDTTKAVPFMENREKKDTVSSTTPWAPIMQAPPPQNPAFATNFNQTPGQTFNTNHLQYPPPNISLLNNIQQFTSTSFPPFQQMQFSQLQLQNQQQQQQQQQSLLQQTTLSELLQKQQKDIKPLNAFDKFKTTVTTPTTTTIQNFLNSNLGSSLANSLFNTTNVTNAFKLADMTNSMKNIQNPFNMDQKFSQSTSSILTSINDNTFNQNSDYTKFFNKVQDSVTDNKFNDKNERRTFQNNSVRDDPREKRSEFHQQNRTRNKYIAGNCVKITNMCPTTTYSDIRKFFSGIYIANNGIKLLNDKQGNRIGTGFIRFVREDSKPKVFLKNGTVLNNKKIVIEDITEREFDDAVDSYKPTKWNKIYDNDDTKSSRSKSPTRDKQKDNNKRLSDTEFSALLVEDLPPFATEQDVMKMFSLYSVIDIIFTRQTTGKKQYIAYVKFHRAEDAKKALSDKMKHTIGHRQVFVSPCSHENFDKAKELHTIRNDNNNDDDDDNDVGDNEEDVKDEKNENDNMKIDNDDNENTEDQDQEESNDTNNQSKDDNDDDDDIQINDDSQNSSNNQKIGMDISNEIPKIPSLLSLNPINLTDPRQRNIKKSNKSNLTRFILLKNCDFKATKVDILYFFGKINLTPLRIELLKNNRGQQNGEIIVEFETPDDANKSLQNNNALCMNRRIRIELVSSSFVENKLGDDFVKQNNNFGNNVQQQQQQNSFNDKNNLNRNIGGGNNSGIRQKPSRFSDANDNRSNSPFENNRNRFGGNNIDKGGFQKSGNDTAGNGSRNNFNNRSNIQQTISNSAVDSFGKPGCVVSLENVPYKAEIEDILEFFDRFNIKPHNVIRRYNDDGTPTGDARVSFPTPNDAQQAVKTRNKQKMFGRTIFLAII